MIKKGLFKEVRFTAIHFVIQKLNEEVGQILEDMESKNWALDDCRITEIETGYLACLIFVILVDDEASV